MSTQSNEQPELIDLDEMITPEQTAVEISSSSSTDSSVELKKRKNDDSPNYANDVVDFNFISDLILPKIDDEEIIDIGISTWQFENFKLSTEQKYHSPVFEVGGQKFNILLFPRGNANNNIALYLEPIPEKHKVEGTDKEAPVDPKWYVCSQFTLIISNPKDDRNYVLNTSHQRFSKDATDWGFSNFVNATYLTNRRSSEHGPLAFNDKVNITACVKVLKDTTGVLWHNFVDYDSKKETGFVGFNNQGATCYLNSLLQSYFFTKSFRKLVYQIPTEDNIAAESVPLALQKIFYQLQRSDAAVDTSELTSSFGWDTGDAFTQHDVQELNRVLMDSLEANMINTPVEGKLNDIFVGKMKSYIKCVNVDYESSRVEDFWDIQLNVKNLSNLTESFQNYIEVELMEGENQYQAQGFGLQDAKKGVVFEEFPDVLHLQLKRFEFNFDYEALVKINDRYEYPESIDLSPYLDNEDQTKIIEPCIYDLHGVLVHAGDLASGHYYTLIKPDESNNWYRFDDDKVWKVTRSQVFDENFGTDKIDEETTKTMSRSEYQNYQVRRFTSAYMLVYIKRDAIKKVLAEVTEEEVPKNVSEEVNAELEKRALEKKEREEMHLYLNLNFYTNELFKNYEGFDLGADVETSRPGLYGAEAFPARIKALKTSKFVDLFPELQEKLKINPSTSNFWVMNYRRNHTIRPSSKLENFEDLTVEEVYQKFFSKKHPFASIWVEEPDLQLLKGTSNLEEAVIVTEGEEELLEPSNFLLFIKLFDVSKQTITGISHIFVPEDDAIFSILPELKKELGLSETDQLEVYEEVNAGTIEKLDVTNSFHKAELSNGDILTVQKIPDLISDEDNPIKLYPFYKTAEEFYDFLQNKIAVNVRPLKESKDDSEYVIVNEGLEKSSEEGDLTHLWISLNAPYEELAKRIASKVGVDSHHLRIFVNYNGQRSALRTDMLVQHVVPKVIINNNITPLFEYEVLTIPLKTLENLRLIKINWLSHGYTRYQVHEFLVDREGTVEDIVEKLQTKLGFSDEQKNDLLIWSNANSKFYQVVFSTVYVKEIDDNLDLYASILPEESQILRDHYLKESESESEEDRILLDEEPKKHPRLTPVLQFYKDPHRLHGIAFIFAVLPNESFKKTKLRLQNKLGLGEKEFGRVEICSWDLQASRATYYKEIVAKRGIPDEELFLYDELSDHDFLAIDHPDRTTRTGGPAASQGGISIRGKAA